MRLSKTFLFSISLLFFSIQAKAQISLTVDQMESEYKECSKQKPDSTTCSRKFLQQMDSISAVVFEKVRVQIPASEKSALIQEQVSWAKKKSDYFKKLDETFVYNLQEGIWKKDMIRITYQQKAEFILKRIKVLIKRLVE